MDTDNFGVIGGDKRQIALAESLAADGYNVYAYGLDPDYLLKGVKCTSLQEEVLVCNNIILPLPVSTDGIYLNTPYLSQKIKLDDHFAMMLKGKRVFGGMMNRICSTSTLWNEIKTYDYSSREEFAVENAVLTAEGAIEIAMHESEGILNGSDCLVIGYGRIGKILSWMLRGIGSRVTVSARKESDLAYIRASGYMAVPTAHICERTQYQIVFNTVPAMVCSRKVLSRITPETLMIDLASSPGGIDYEAAEKLGIRTIKALSLPGKVAPRAAGEIIKNTIYHIIEE